MPKRPHLHCLRQCWRRPYAPIESFTSVSSTRYNQRVIIHQILSESRCKCNSV